MITVRLFVLAIRATLARLLVMGFIIALTSCHKTNNPTVIWSQTGTGLSCGILVNPVNVRTSQTVFITFVVSNSTHNAISVPVPGTGTLIFDTVVTDANRDFVGFDGHTALGANLGSRDKWVGLEPGKALMFSFSHKWMQVGVQDVYLRYYTRFKDTPFKTMETPKVRITVNN